MKDYLQDLLGVKLEGNIPIAKTIRGIGKRSITKL